MSRDSSRKPSTSSSQSGAHSPTTSPGNQPHSSRRITPTTTGNMLSVGVATGTGLMSYNPGWQVWGPRSPSQRNPSVSSATSANELPSPQGDTGFRGTTRESWTSSRPASGTWDEDAANSPHLKDFSQSHESQTPLGLHPSRQRQGSAAPFSAQKADNRPAKLSPQAYDLNPESASPRYGTTPSSGTFATPYSSASFSAPQASNLTGASGYDSLTNPIEDFAMSFRGMATVDDDYSTMPKVNLSPHPPPTVPMPSTVMQRPPHQVPIVRPPYNNNFPGFAEYAYNAPPMDPAIYSSSTLSNATYPGIPPGMVPPPTGDVHRQPNLFYDFAHSRPPVYYATQQGIMFPPTSSPMIPSQHLAIIPPTLDKKHELSFNLNMQPQQLAQMMFSRPSPSSHLPVYPNALDFSQVPQLTLMMPGGPLFGANVAAPQIFGLQQGRLRSPILEEFRNNKTRNWELRDLIGHVVEFSGDQHGSRFIQQKLESASSEEKQKVFDEIVPDNILQLIQDVFGNYVVQKLFEHGTQLQKTRLASEMEGHILALSKQMYGCRVVQKAIECVLPEQQAMIVRELEPYIMDCIHDANGNHVIQKLIERVSPERLGFVRTFRGNVQVLATHMFGCRVLQRALEHLPEAMMAPLVEELHKCTLPLTQNQFGNYVMQFVIEKGKPQDRLLVINKLQGKLFILARHKFASNVCEMALVHADPDTRRQLIAEIISPNPEGAIVLTMMKDQYANYVLQRAVEVADADQREILIELITPQIAVLRRFANSYSKHLVSIERLLQKFAP